MACPYILRKYRTPRKGDMPAMRDRECEAYFTRRRSSSSRLA
jgi:hypothetical protein